MFVNSLQLSLLSVYISLINLWLYPFGECCLNIVAMDFDDRTKATELCCYTNMQDKDTKSDL